MVPALPAIVGGCLGFFVHMTRVHFGPQVAIGFLVPEFLGVNRISQARNLQDAVLGVVHALVNQLDAMLPDPELALLALGDEGISQETNQLFRIVELGNFERQFPIVLIDVAHFENGVQLFEEIALVAGDLEGEVSNGLVSNLVVTLPNDHGEAPASFNESQDPRLIHTNRYLLNVKLLVKV